MTTSSLLKLLLNYSCTASPKLRPKLRPLINLVHVNEGELSLLGVLQDVTRCPFSVSGRQVRQIRYVSRGVAVIGMCQGLERSRVKRSSVRWMGLHNLVCTVVFCCIKQLCLPNNSDKFSLIVICIYKITYI